MSQRQWQRYHAVQAVVDGQLRPGDIAAGVGLSVRQVRRLVARVGAEGPAGVRHGNTGRAPWNAVSAAVRARVVALSRAKYPDANDTHFTELLAAHEGLVLSRALVAQIRRAAGIAPKQGRVAPQYRRRRERRPAEGGMGLWDGSEHRWFGATAPACCLMAVIDDATGQVVAAHFQPTETSAGYLTLLQQLATGRGLPLSLYQDRHSALKRNDEHWSLDEQLAGRQDPTQVGRALEALGVTPIFALSPQAKGRVERLWRTLQDRWPVEFRLAGITTPEAANAALPALLAAHNAQFGVEAASPTPVWRAPDGVDLARVLAFGYTAKVRGDHTIRLGGHCFDLPPGPRGRGYAGQEVEVRQLLDGRWRIYRGETLLQEVAATPLVEPLRRYKRRPGVRATHDAVDTPDDWPAAWGVPRLPARVPGHGLGGHRLA